MGIQILNIHCNKLGLFKRKQHNDLDKVILADRLQINDTTLILRKHPSLFIVNMRDKVIF